jgi:hypothetical protein
VIPCIHKVHIYKLWCLHVRFISAGKGNREKWHSLLLSDNSWLQITYRNKYPNDWDSKAQHACCWSLAVHVRILGIAPDLLSKLSI